MKKNKINYSITGAVCSIALFMMLFINSGNTATFVVNSQQEFDAAQNNAVMNDSIIWESGTYTGIYLNITKSNLHISAATLGGTIFTGVSRANISGDYITFRGFQFLDGNIGTNDVINITGSHLLINEINIRAYTSYKYLRIREASQYVDVTYCNFENRLNLDDQNILSILVDANQPGYHKIQHCSFKNFAGTGNDLGIEPIRIGLSTQADRISRSLVEYCYFTECDGDGELISSKATQNVYRFNTFENNSKAELVLRHGSEAIVYGNFFLNGKGGVRVREGQDHYIYNNYFSGINDRAIYLQNESSDPLDNINIAFNTIVDCSEVILGGNGSFKPTNVTFANNVFTDPDNRLFEEATGTETWIGNIANGTLGITLPANGITVVNPELVANSEGFFGLSENSPAINAAQSGYTTLPQFAGMEAIDMEILFDLMGQNRPSLIGDKDLGCNEYPHNILIEPIATESNTGPSYNTSPVNGVTNNPLMVQDLLQVFPNPASSQITITLENDYTADIKVDIIDLQGTILKTLHRASIPAGKQSIKQNIGELPAGIYTVRAYSESRSNGAQRMQTTLLIKL